ncbi:MAG: ankyrin repeat domain-containing protein [Burkholderiaceae bacterium]
MYRVSQNNVGGSSGASGITPNTPNNVQNQPPVSHAPVYSIPFTTKVAEQLNSQGHPERGVIFPPGSGQFFMVGADARDRLPPLGQEIRMVLDTSDLPYVQLPTQHPVEQLNEAHLVPLTPVAQALEAARTWKAQTFSSYAGNWTMQHRLRSQPQSSTGPTVSSESYARALGNAAKNGKLDELKALLNSKEFNIDSFVPADGNNFKRPLIGWAVSSGNAEAVRYLLNEQHADPNVATPSGSTPLHIAANKGNVEIVKLLVEGGANTKGVFIANANTRYTPLHLAALKGNLEVVQYLVEEAKVDPSGPLDLSPAHVMARKAGKHNVADYLEKMYAASPAFERAIVRNASMVEARHIQDAPVFWDGHKLMHLNAMPDCFVPGIQKRLVNRPIEGRQSGVLTAMINNLSTQNQQLPLAPKLTVALGTSGTFRETDIESDRRAVEAGIVAHWDGHLQFNPDSDVIQENNMEVSEQQRKNLGARMVNAYLQGGLIQPGDDVMDVGTGQGYVPKLLEQKGVSVEAIEPFLEGCGKQVFDRTQPLTVEEYLIRNPGRKFSVVHAGNIHPTALVTT